MTEDLGGPCPRCGNETETVLVCCSAHGQAMCASCYCTTHFVEFGRDEEIERRLRPVPFEEGCRRLFALGFHCIESEITDSWAILWAWRKHHRDERICSGEPTVGHAMRRLVAKAEEAG